MTRSRQCCPTGPRNRMYKLISTNSMLGHLRILPLQRLVSAVARTITATTVAGTASSNATSSVTSLLGQLEALFVCMLSPMIAALISTKSTLIN